MARSKRKLDFANWTCCGPSREERAHRAHKLMHELMHKLTHRLMRTFGLLCANMRGESKNDVAHNLQTRNPAQLVSQKLNGLQQQQAIEPLHRTTE